MQKSANLFDPAKVASSLLDYCRTNDWAGYDPYDALNSKLLQALGIANFKYPRLILTQLLKRSPLNLRRLLLVPREQNPKGIALFLSAAVKLTKIGLLENDGTIRNLIDRLAALASTNNGYTGWGYNFDWQTRSVLVPRGTPNIICTTFAGNALLDANPDRLDGSCLDLVTAAARFLQDCLYFQVNGSEACYAYYPHERTLIHNANLLGAAFLCRLARATGEKALFEPALKAARFSMRRQHEDGSWDYGESDRPSQRWIDNFHTGFVLCALRRIAIDAETSEFEAALRRGFAFYRQHFFEEDGAPKYYNQSLYPIDIHSAAQSIITLVTLSDLDKGNLDLANLVLTWTMSQMWNPEGYFFFQKYPRWTVKIPYMRWSQAWMLLALATMAEGSVEAVRGLYICAKDKQAVLSD
jgi:hypothetical protein